MSDIGTDAKRTPKRRLLVRARNLRTPASETRSDEARDSATGPQIIVRDLHKSYRKARIEIPVLRGVDLCVEAGEFVSIIGSSGSGKSTLLHLLGMLDAPDQGEILFAGKRVDSLSTRQRDRMRNREIGLIFQFYHLLPELTVLENVLMPRMIGSSIWSYPLRRREYRERATHLLEKVGLGHRMNHKPRELSGGEMQRTAIARSLMVSPKLLLADEPTGNLDARNGTDIMRILRELNETEKLTILMVTHDTEIAAQADSTIRLVEGRVHKSRNGS